MRQILSKYFNGKNKTLNYCLIGLLIIVATVSVSSFFQSATTSKQSNANTTEVGTSYDYQATITPNILYPEGGTMDVGDRIFKEITTAIPVNLKSIINSDNEVTAKGTHEVQLVVKAGELWERVFPLQEKKSFELKGTDIALIDNAFNIDLNKINAFITQVEEETGIRSEQYLLEISPNIEGTISYAGKETLIPEQDNLVFQSSYEEIMLISDKSFTSVIPFTSSEVIANAYNFFGAALPLGPVRLISTILSILLPLPIIYLYKDLLGTRKRIKTQVDKINQKYGSRLVPVAHRLNVDGKSTIILQSFKSILKIADEKELPIFCHKMLKDGSAIYFIIDGEYVYHYETIQSEVVQRDEKGKESVDVYAKS